MVNALTVQTMKELKVMVLSVVQILAISDKEFCWTEPVNTASFTSEYAKMQDAAFNQLVPKIKSSIRTVLAKTALSMRCHLKMATLA